MGAGKGHRCDSCELRELLTFTQEVVEHPTKATIIRYAVSMVLRIVAAINFMILGALPAFAQPSPQCQSKSDALQTREVELARLEVERVADLIANGSLPIEHLQDAEDRLGDAQGNAILARTLYEQLPLEKLNEQMAENLVAAAQRLMERQMVRLQRAAPISLARVCPRFRFIRRRFNSC